MSAFVLGSGVMDRNYHLAWIPSGFEDMSMEMFHAKHLQKLINLGHQTAKRDYPWLQAAPGFKQP